LFPFIGLTYALIWTYGLMNLFGGRFTALEVAVAPLVLGLGIDYSIHLQRRFASYLESEEDTSKAWMATCGHLFAPLTLAVVTTIAAFLANLFSPLDPIRYFGLALAIGVISAFVSSTLVVGSLHVLFSKTSENTPRTLELPRLSSWLSSLHREQQAAILLGTIIISGASIIGATGLETEFDLTDFLDEDMEIMQSRGMLEDSYESAGWKFIYVLMEPADGESIPGDDKLLAELRGMHSDFESNDQVVGTQSRTASPTYEGPYVVLRDAILRNVSFGEKYGLKVFKGDGQVYAEGSLNLALVYADLGQNNSVADPLTGDTWADRVNHTVHLENNQIVYLRNEIMVDARTSADSNKVVDDFELMLGTTDEAGKPRGVLANHAIIHLTGDLVQLDHVLTALNTSQLNSTAFSLFASLVVLFLLTRKIVPTLIVLLPVVIATLWVVGSMIILGLKWNVLTVMVTALSIGIGIDYTIHMWRRYERNKAEGMERREALEDSIATTGVALIISSATTALGFIVLMLSRMPLIQDFGLITALTVISSLVLCLVVLPVLLSLSEKQLSSGDS
ncbi:MAG: MMPL family transporter, partial [Candidatus Thermoplasmatota archaeon]|nr:MMPL family transporter [Candidatus Thermoplasmatota archaeon]